MPVRMNTLKQVCILILIMLTPIILLYGYSYQKSVDVVKEEIRNTNVNRLNFFRSQIDTAVNQLSMNALSLMSDPDIRTLKYIDSIKLMSEKTAIKTRIVSKLTAQSTASGWISDMSVFSPNTGETFTTGAAFAQGSPVPPNVSPTSRWQSRRMESTGTYEFYRVFADPLAASTEQAIRLQISFRDSNLVKMLEEFKNEGRGNPFFYHPDGKWLATGGAKPDMILQLTAALDESPLADNGYRYIKTGGRTYFVSFVKSEALDWLLVDYMPLGEILKPINLSRNLFYLSVVFLFLLGVIVAYLLYRRIQVPIKNLIIGVQRLKSGDYSARIRGKHYNEFDFINIRFNEMAEEIENLIENVYKEKLRSREATLKQLQAQINPHFLYNCLHFIHLNNYRGDREAVSSMVLSLGKYFRYTTRLEKQFSTLRDELDLVGNYLEIQNLRMRRLEYEIVVPDAMLDIPVPRLLLQPIVENAVIHGADQVSGPYRIRIVGEDDGEWRRITVEDNGCGLTEAELADLASALNRQLEEETGFGIWNVHQRLANYFGEGSGVRLSHRSGGGLRVALVWRKKEIEVASDGTAAVGG